MDCGFAEDSPQPPTATAPFKEGSWKPSKSQMDELGLVWLEVGAHRIQNHEPAVFGQRVELVDLVLEQAHVAAGERAPQVNHDGDVVQHVALGGLGRYSTEIVTTAEAIGPSWLREIWICGIDPAPRVERCAERAFRRSCITA